MIKAIAISNLVLLFLILFILGSLPKETKPTPLPLNNPTLESRVQRLEIQVQQLRQIVGLEGPNARPEGLQNRKAKKR